MIALAQPSLLGVLAAMYAVAGGAVALKLSADESPLTCATALLAWPVFLPLLIPTVVAPSGGPLHGKIEAAFTALETTLNDPAAGDVPWTADLTGLRDALLRTDERLALVDTLLADSPRADALTAARARTAAEMEAVIEEVLQLRLQIGLAALAGNTASVHERLAELLLRAHTLEEVTQIHG